MALGILGIFYIVLIIIALIIQVLLYKNTSKNSIFIINMIFGIMLSYISFTSLPSNYTEQKNLAIALGVTAVLAAAIKLKTNRYVLTAKVMLSVSIIGSFLQLLL